MKNKFSKLAALLLAGAALLASGCTDYEADIQELNKRLDNLISVTVANLDGQVQGLLSTVSTLETAAKHDEDIQKINKTISDLETALKSDYGKKIQDAVDILNAAIDGKLDKSTFNSAKEQIESGMQGLRDRIQAIEDADFQKQINNLNTALGTRLNKLEGLLEGDWDGKTVKQAIDGVIQTIVDLETALNGEIGTLKSRMGAAEAAIKKIKEETIPALISQISDLQSGKVDKSDFNAYKGSMSQTIGLIQDAINELSAVSAGFPEDTTIKKYIDNVASMLRDEIAIKYLSIIAKAFGSEQKMNEMKGNLLARLEALEALLTIEGSSTTVQQYIDNQISVIQSQLALITNADGNGRLDLLEKSVDSLADHMDDVLAELQFAEGYEGKYGDGLQGYIKDSVVEAYENAIEYTDDYIEFLVDGINEQLENIYGYIRDLQDRIQSIVFVPDYDDMKITVNVPSDPAEPVLAHITYKILPSRFAAQVANDGNLFFDVKSVQTRSGEGDPSVEILSCEYDENVDYSGLITFTVRFWNFSSYNYAISLWLYREEGAMIYDNDIIFTENELCSSYNLLYPVYE